VRPFGPSTARSVARQLICRGTALITRKMSFRATVLLRPISVYFAVLALLGSATRPHVVEVSPADEFPATRPAAASDPEDEPVVHCANLTYAGSKSSQCFSDKFLATTERETHIRSSHRFDPVKLADNDLFKYPFAIMTGEGPFTLLDEERVHLKSYLLRGGFLLASAGCSSQEWDLSFRTEIRRVFPDLKLKTIPMDHKLFGMVFDISTIRLKKSEGTCMLEGLEINNKIVLIYSPEGLNDTGNVEGCCCCGGNEVRNSQEVNVNVLAYSLTH